VQEADAKYKAAEAAVQLAVQNKAAADNTYSLADASRDATGAINGMASAKSSAGRSAMSAGDGMDHYAGAADRASKASNISSSATRSVKVNMDALAVSLGVAADQMDLVGQMQNRMFLEVMKGGSVRTMTSYIDAINDSWRRAAAAVNDYARAQAQADALNSEAAQGVYDLRMELAELEGDEVRIARAKEERSKAELAAKKAALEADLKLADINGETEKVRALRQEIALLKDQELLVEAISAKQQAIARSAPKEPSPDRTTAATTGSFSNQTVKTVKIDFGQGQSIDVQPGQEAVVERVIKDLSTGRARA
jgi:hypothetical protein